MKRIIFLCVILIFFGCNRVPISGLVPAQGKVLFDGVPIDNVNIVFTPQPGSTSDRFATAVTKKDGTFTLETNGYAGVLPCQYNVTLSKITTISKISREEEEKLSIAGKPIPAPDIVYHIPWKYESTQTSGISIIIDEKGKTDILIELKTDNTPPPIRPKI
jgi:uncharacterized protein with FMN-binding domain